MIVEKLNLELINVPHYYLTIDFGLVSQIGVDGPYEVMLVLRAVQLNLQTRYCIGVDVLRYRKVGLIPVSHLHMNCG